MHFGMILVRPVTKVQPERVHAREEEGFKHFRRSARRTDCSHDFSPAIASHRSSGLRAAPGDQNSSDIVDVGACRTGANEVADPIEETETVVRGKVGAW